MWLQNLDTNICGYKALYLYNMWLQNLERKCVVDMHIFFCICNNSCSLTAIKWFKLDAIKSCKWKNSIFHFSLCQFWPANGKNDLVTAGFCHGKSRLITASGIDLPGLEIIMLFRLVYSKLEACEYFPIGLWWRSLRSDLIFGKWKKFIWGIRNGAAHDLYLRHFEADR